MSNQREPRELEFSEVQTWLMENLYMIRKNGKFVLTDRFQQAVKSEKPNSNRELAGTSQEMVIRQPVIDWSMRFMEFIAACQIPAKISDAKGGLYAGNKYNNEAAREWKSMIESGGISEPVLIMSTMLYYKSNLKYKKAIGNYILQGDWRTDYMELLNAKQRGMIDQHIKSRTDGGEHSGWKLG